MDKNMFTDPAQALLQARSILLKAAVSCGPVTDEEHEHILELLDEVLEATAELRLQVDNSYRRNQIMSFPDLSRPE